jgi:hypothetical protein
MTLSSVDYTRFIVHDWGTIFELFPFILVQVFMWGEHVVDLPITEVEVAKLQRCNIFLVCADCVYPLREVHSDQSVLKFSGHTVSIDCAA